MRPTIFAFLLSLAAFPAAGQVTPDSAAVLQIDNAWQQAKLNADLPMLSRIMADQFYEMNQNGNGRDKVATLELWNGFRIESLTTDSRDVRLADDTATVIGTQTEINGTGVDRMLFTRVYVRRGAGWQLLTSTQFRNPKADVALIR
jgi:hypothetical protein